MTESEILLRLKARDQFTGQGLAFSGIVTPYGVEEDSLLVECRKDGSMWLEQWDLLSTVWGFENGEYKFIEKTV